MSNESIKVFSPATIANVGCGFDVLGFALKGVGDDIVVHKVSGKDVKITKIEGSNAIPYASEKNVSSVAILALLKEYEGNAAFEIEIYKKVSPGSGLGSSASSSAGAVFAANELLGRPFSKEKLVEFAMEGERVASQKPHADNVAPAIFGGFTLVRGYSPLDIVGLEFPENLYATVAHPQVEVKTADAKKILKKQVDLNDAITQWGNVGGLVAGLMKKDLALIGRSLEDVIVEPVRSILIPMFEEVKQKAMESGALGFAIAGSGPSVFAFSDEASKAENIKNSIAEVYKRAGIKTNLYVSQVNPNGVEVIA